MRNKIFGPPRVAEILLRMLFPKREKYDLLGDYEEYYKEIYSSRGRFIANLWYGLQILFTIPTVIGNSIKWSCVMIKNNLKILFRNLKRHKGYSFVNISGLSLGIMCCIFIFLYIRYETSYDDHHEDADRIYRIIASVDSPTGTTVYGGTAHQLTPYIQGNFKQAEAVAKVTPWRSDQQVKYRDKIFNEIALDIPFADEDIFKILSFQFIQGNPESALLRPLAAVITAETAGKYFGDENPMGKVLSIGDDNFEITGVIEDLPGNTIFKFHILRSWNALDPSMFYPRWMNYHTTFIKLIPGVHPDNFAKLLTQTIVDHSKEDLVGKGEYTSILQPIQEVYLNSKDFTFERVEVSNIIYIYVFTGIGILILCIASINFVNLITARSSSRACEVGMRKVVGAHRKQLVTQFICESLLMTAMSFIFAIMVVFLLLNNFNQLAQLKIEYASLVKPDFIFIIVIAIIVLGLAAGSYPAVFLSSFKPIVVLRGSLKLGAKGQKLRKILVISQYTLSIAMIIGAITFICQLHFMKNEPLGFEKDQKLIVHMPETGIGRNNYISVKEEFTNYPSILGASFSTSVPGRSLYYTRLWPTGQRATNSQDVNWIDTDGDFISVYGLNIIAGRNPRDVEMTSRSNLPGVLNETAVSTFGWDSPEDALNQTFRDRDPKGFIVGVVKDFHFAGLQNAIEPLSIMFRGGYRYLTLKIETENIGETLEYVEDKFQILFPDRIFEYFFLDEDFNRQYLREEQTAKIFGIFTFLGILIASLGLIGLAAFVAQQRTKEIGIRKIMGASSQSIVNLLIKEFLHLVLAANIIAWPVAYYVMHRWLQNFAYRINIPMEIFILSGVLALLIAVITVSYQSIKAARANPVEALHCE